MGSLDNYMLISDLISRGEVDAHLGLIEKSLILRREIVGDGITMDDLSVGDRVMLNHRCDIKHRGKEGTIIEKKRKRVRIEIEGEGWVDSLGHRQPSTLTANISLVTRIAV